MLGVVMLSVVAPYYSGKGITFKTNPYPLSKDAAKSNYLDKTSLLIFPLFDGEKSSDCCCSAPARLVIWKGQKALNVLVLAIHTDHQSQIK